VKLLFKKKSASPEYLTHYGMHRAPFSAAIEDDMYYTEPTRAQRLDILLHLTQYADELLIVTGEEGSGKTTLLEQYLKKAKDAWKICRIDAYPVMQEEQALQRIYSGFDMRIENDPSQCTLSTLKRYIGSALANIPTMVLIIDNAHILPINVIGLLLDIANTRNLTTGRGLRTLFFCEPQIKILLANPELQDKLKQPQRKIDLPRFQVEHTGCYLRHRLSQAGMVAERFLTDSSIAKIQKQSHGIPGKINAVADKLLFETTPIIRRTSNGKKHSTAQSNHQQTKRRKPKNRKSSNRKKTGFKIKEHYLLAAAIIALISVILFFQDEINNLFRTLPNVAALIVNNDHQHTVTSLPLQNPALLAKPDKQRFIQGTLPTTQDNNDGKPANKTQPPAIIADTPDTPIPTTESSIISSDNNHTNNWNEHTSQQDTSVASQQTTSTKPKIPPLTKIDKIRSPTTNTQTAPGLKNEQWLLTQNPDHYTLQLVAGHHKSTVVKFIEQYKLATPELSYFYSHRNGKNWHNLLYGIYPNHKSAFNAIKSLPLPMTKIKPWIRSMESIQIDIYRTQQ